MFGNLLKISGHDQKCSQWFTGVEKFRSWFLRSPQKDPSKLLRASNDGKVEWNTTHRILPVAILAFDWLHFSSRHGIKYNTIQYLAIQYVHCNTTQLQCNATQYLITIQHNSVQKSTIQKHTVVNIMTLNTWGFGTQGPHSHILMTGGGGGSKCLFGPPESNSFLFFAGAVTLIFKPFRIV